MFGRDKERKDILDSLDAAMNAAQSFADPVKDEDKLEQLKAHLKTCYMIVGNMTGRDNVQ
ncbi:MAG: hypothetical protein KGL39_52900 [Patescibacteria group bacterium]|nr:hypothetical protein [Patescibacteria group bacterium]